jgi:hypothetical protein
VCAEQSIDSDAISRWPCASDGTGAERIADPEIQSTCARSDDKAGSEGFDDNLQAANKALAKLTAWAN